MLLIKTIDTRYCWEAYPWVNHWPTHTTLGVLNGERSRHMPLMCWWFDEKMTE